METQDLRYLLKTTILPEYSQTVLIDVWDSILKEYEVLTNTHMYSQTLRKINSDTSKINRINGLSACYHLLDLKPELALEDLKYWKIPIKDNSIESLNKLLTIINQEKTRYKIAEIRKTVPEQLKVEFEDLVFFVENNIGANYIQLDVEKITVSKWVKMLKSIEKRAEAIKKINDGRKYATSK